MKRSLSIFSLGLSLIFLFSSTLFAVDKSAETEQPKTEDTKEVISRSYDGGIPGLKALMRDLKKEDPQVHDQLLPDFKKLKQKRNIAMGVSLGGLAAGSYFIVKSFTQSSTDDFDSDQDNFMSNFLIGCGIYLGGYTIGSILYPKSQDYKNFTNKHNKLNPKSQIRWDRASLMFLGKDQPVYLALGFKF